MANYNTIHTANTVLNMTEEEAAELNRLLELGIPDPDYAVEGQEYDPEDNLHSGFEIDYADGVGFLVTSDRSENSNADHLSEEFLNLLGTIIERNGTEYLVVGEAWVCSRNRPASHGGTALRIWADGFLEYPDLVYAHELVKKDAAGT